ncbi:MAG: hypothetical protein AB7O66_03440 [Limisphaerales bacterium]
MHAIRIKKLSARYHLPPSAGGQKRRLDGLLASALLEALEPALDRVGLGSDEHLCIRHLTVPVRLRLSAPDPRLVDTWGDALGRAMTRAAELGLRGRDANPSTEMVWFASTAHAFVDLGRRVARHDLRHAWAWRQLDLWRAEEGVSASGAIREFLRALLRNPERIVSTFRALAGTSALGELASRLDADHWIALVAAALESAGVDLRVADLRNDPRSRTGDRDGAREDPNEGLLDEGGRGARSAGGAVRRGRSFVSSLQVRSGIGRVVPLASVPASARRALACLILLDADPGWTLRPRRAWLNWLDEMGRARSGGEDPVGPEPRTRRPGDLTEGMGDEGSTTRGAGAGDLVDEERERESDEPTPGSGPADAADGMEEADPGGEFDDAKDDPSPDPRRRGRTRHGGLLFVLNLLNTTDWLGRLASALPGRGLRWVLNQLAMALVPVESSDPAALAFAGLAPGSAELLEDEPPAEPEERESVAVLADRIRGELAGVLERLELRPEAAAEFVCARPAEIVADPGWIEARFALKDVSTDLRRAGLDKDPGYLRWLGCVVRFAYE